MFTQIDLSKMSRTLFRTVKELILDGFSDNVLIQKGVRGPLLGAFVITDRTNNPIVDSLFFKLDEAIEFAATQLEISKDDKEYL